MKANSIKMFAKNIGLSLQKSSPELLVGLGIAGMVATVVLAVKATPKAAELVEEEKKRQNEKLFEEAKEKGEPNCIQVTELKPADTVKAAWKCYIPTAISGAISISCIIGGISLKASRYAALATAYTISETKLKDYQEKVVETFGEKKEQEVRDAIAQDKVRKNPPIQQDVILTNKGNTLCYDANTGRYFRSSIEKIKDAEINLNRRLMDEMYISLNEFYYELGLPTVKLGDDLGWNIEDGKINLAPSSILTDEDEPCYVVDFDFGPRYDFRNLL